HRPRTAARRSDGSPAARRTCTRSAAWSLLPTLLAWQTPRLPRAGEEAGGRHAERGQVVRPNPHPRDDGRVTAGDDARLVHEREDRADDGGDGERPPQRSPPKAQAQRLAGRGPRHRQRRSGHETDGTGGPAV